MVGLPGSGKTTHANDREFRHVALRLTPDEWIVALFGEDLDRPQRDAVRDPVEAVLWQVARRAPGLGCTWSLTGACGRVPSVERTANRRRIWVRVEGVFLDADVDELWSRIARRDESAGGTLHITRSGLEHRSTLFAPPTE